MPIARTAFIWTTLGLFLAGFLALLSIVITSWWLIERSEQYFDDVLQARDIRTVAVAVRKDLQDMETGQRGFILTSDEAYLEPYEVGRGDVITSYEGLKAMLGATQEASSLDRLGQAIASKIGEIDETIRLHREGRTNEAIEIIRTNRGKAAMDDARTLLDRIIATADALVGNRVEVHRANTSALRWVTIVGGLFIIAVAGGALFAAMRYTREIVAARAELEVLNDALEERVEERTEDLLRANEEIQRFAYIVTHDLRAPLVNIMGFTSELDQTMKTVQSYVLADGEPLSEQSIHEARTAAAEDLPEAIGFIRASTKKMDGLINAILKISREGRRQIKPETIEMGELLENAAASVRHQVAESEGEVVVSAKIPPIVGDRFSLEQIFGNLLDNAVKYRADRPIHINIAARPLRGNRVQIDVADNGRGIAEQDHQRVFDLFRRAGTQDKPGEGIGLAHVRSLVRNMGGDVKLTSEFGEGTTFSVILPTDIRTIVRSNNVEQ